MNQYDNPEFFAEYAKMSRSKYGLEGAGEWHQLEPMFPELAGKTVLDLGCGYGWHCKYAADRGAAQVLGIDQSARMIEEAKRRNSADCIEYRVCGIHDFDYPEETYDLAVSNLVLHYVENLEEVYALVRRTLKPGGIFLFNIEHPTFTAGVNQQFSADGTWSVTDYYYTGQRKTDFLGYEVKKYHHTLTQILNGLLQTGFVMEAVEEAMPPEQWRDQMPEEMRRPMMLLVRARKANINYQAKSSIREYRSSDCPELAKLFYDTVHAVNAADYTPEQLDAWATGEVDLNAWNNSLLAHHTVVAEKNSVIVGFGDMDESGYLDRLYVHKDFGRQGIATAICDALETASDAKTFTTHASITARPFFEQRGYTVIKEQQVERRGILLTNFVMKKEQ